MEIKKERVFQCVINNTPRTIIVFDYEKVLELIDTIKGVKEQRKVLTQYLKFIFEK